MDALDLDISALCEDAKAPSRRYWLPVMVTGLGREYAKRWFTDKRKEGNDFPFALVVAETEDEARKWAHGCTDVEAVIISGCGCGAWPPTGPSCQFQ